jgi:hypothetical protein
MKLTYSNPTTGVGAWLAWESKSEGNGKMTISELSDAKVTYQLEFPDMGTSSTGSIELRAQAGGIEVVWVDVGDLGMNPMNRWFGLILEKLIAPDFERGLANLSRLVEK